MPTFEFTLERNGELFDVSVEAEDEAAAEAAAVQEISGPAYMSDAERKQKIANLDAELQATKDNDGSFFHEVVVPTVTQAGAGIADATLGIGQAVADAGGALGSDTLLDAGEWLANRREQIKEDATDIQEAHFGYAWGRAPTESERADIRKNSERGMWLAELATEVGYSLTPAKFTAAAKTLPRALALGAGEGAASMFLLTDSDAEHAADRTWDRLKGASVGAVFGGAANGVFVGLPAAFKNSMARYVDRAIRNAGGREAYARAAEDVGGMLTVGQWTGDPRILLAEQRAAGALAQEAVAAQKQNIIYQIGRELGVELPAVEKLGSGTRGMLENYATTVKRAVARERGRVNSAFRARMKAAEEVHQGPVLKLDKMGEDIFRILQEAHGSYGTKVINPGIRKMIEDIAEAGEKGASPEQLNKWLATINSMREANGAGFYKNVNEIEGPALDKLHRLGMAHLGVLKNGIDNAIQQAAGTGSAGQAIKIMQNARKILGNRKNKIAQMEKEVVHSLGLEGGTAMEVIARLGQQDPKEVRHAVELLRKMEGGPEALGSLKEALIHGSAQAGAGKAAKQQGTRLGSFNLGDFLDNFARNSKDAVSSGIITPAEKAYANQALDHARRIMNSGIANGGVVQTVSHLEVSNVAINFVSRDPGFIARLLGGVIEKGKGAEWLFFTKEGTKMLADLKAVTVGGNMSRRALESANAAAAVLVDMIGEGAYDAQVQ